MTVIAAAFAPLLMKLMKMSGIKRNDISCGSWNQPETPASWYRLEVREIIGIEMSAPRTFCICWGALTAARPIPDRPSTMFGTQYSFLVARPLNWNAFAK